MDRVSQPATVADEGRLLVAKLCADPRPNIVAEWLARETAADATTTDNGTGPAPTAATV